MRRRILRAGVALFATVVGCVVGTPPASAAPGPPDAPQWWFDSWNVPSVWASGVRGQGIVIAEVDTGVNTQVPELAQRVLPGTDFGDSSLDGRTDHDVDAFGHGTAMASLMVAQPGLYGLSGLAPDARLLPVAVPIHGTDDAGPGADDNLPEAIRWAVDRGAKIVSLSLGGIRRPERDRLPCPADEQAAITYAIEKGAVVVAASGNAGESGSPVEDPGVCLGVVSVGAVDAAGVVAPFSSRHPYLTVTAPGVAIPSLSREPESAFIGDGTSQATALASAAFALVWSKYPALTARQLVARVLATLDHSRAPRDPAYGFGTLDVARAVTADVPDGASNPVFAALDPFLSRHEAAAAVDHQPAPSPAVTKPRPPGTFAVGSPASSVPPAMIVGIAVAALGLLGLLALGGFGIIWRTRRAPAPVTAAAP